MNPEFEDRVSERQQLKKTEDESKSQRKALDKKIEAALVEAGRKTCDTETGRVIRCECDGRVTADLAALRRDGLDEYLRKGNPYSYIEVRQVA